MLSFYFNVTSFELYGNQVKMPHLAVSQNNYQVKFISLHMNRLKSPQRRIKDTV